MQLGYSPFSRGESIQADLQVWESSFSLLTGLLGEAFSVPTVSWYNKAARTPAVLSHSSYQKKRRKPREGCSPFSWGSWRVVLPTSFHCSLLGLCHMACELQEKLNCCFPECSCELWRKIKLEKNKWINPYCHVCASLLPGPSQDDPLPRSFHLSNVHLCINVVGMQMSPSMLMWLTCTFA